MIKFVEKWFKSSDEKAAEADGSLTKWIDPAEGLPSTDREVVVLVLTTERIHGLEYEVKKQYRYARFHPGVGWEMQGSKAKVLLWKDEDLKAANIPLLLA